MKVKKPTGAFYLFFCSISKIKRTLVCFLLPVLLFCLSKHLEGPTMHHILEGGCKPRAKYDIYPDLCLISLFLLLLVANQSREAKKKKK